MPGIHLGAAVHARKRGLEQRLHARTGHAGDGGGVARHVFVEVPLDTPRAFHLGLTVSVAAGWANLIGELLVHGDDILAYTRAKTPIYARDILQVGASGLSQLAMAPALGAAVTALWFSFRPLKNNVGPRMLWAVAAFGVATVIFGLSTWLPLSLAMLFIVGCADMFSVFIRQSLIQLHTPDDKRGRVSAVSTLFISASNELGEFESGALAWMIGAVPAVLVGGAGAVCAERISE